MKKLITAVVLTFCLSAICAAQQSANVCDFTAFKPLIISDVLFNGAIKKVLPKYPAAARKVNAEGLVSVKILVDRQGNVVRACAASGHPLLRAAARNAALGWKFKENFGLSQTAQKGQRKPLLQLFIYFDFKP